MKPAELIALIGLTGCAHDEVSEQKEPPITAYECTPRQKRQVNMTASLCAMDSYAWRGYCEEQAIRDLCTLRSEKR